MRQVMGLCLAMRHPHHSQCSTPSVFHALFFYLVHSQPWRRLCQPMVKANAPCKVISVLSLDPKCSQKQYAHLVFLPSTRLQCVLRRE